MVANRDAIETVGLSMRGRPRRHETGAGGRHGFTLVELLIVIGISVVLIAMLLPALSRARAQANTVACSSNLRQIYQIFAMHAADHQGYFPYAGPCCNATGLIYPTPANINDRSMTKYNYCNVKDTLNNNIQVPLPLGELIGSYAGDSIRTDTLADMVNDAGVSNFPTGVYARNANCMARRIMCCPSDERYAVTQSLYLADATLGAQVTFGETQYFSSYIFNDDVLGWMPGEINVPPGQSVAYERMVGYKRAGGNIATVRRQTDTCLAMEYAPWQSLTFNSDGSFSAEGSNTFLYGCQADATLWDALIGDTGSSGGGSYVAGNTDNFTLLNLRHASRFNVLFCDGHVAGAQMPTPIGLNTAIRLINGAGITNPGDLKNIYLNFQE